MGLPGAAGEPLALANGVSARRGRRRRRRAARAHGRPERLDARRGVDRAPVRRHRREPARGAERRRRASALEAHRRRSPGAARRAGRRCTRASAAAGSKCSCARPPVPTSRSCPSPASARCPRRREAALPFLLDQLAEIAGTPGDLVRDRRRRARAAQRRAARSFDARRAARLGRQPGRRAHRRRAVDRRHGPRRRSRRCVDDFLPAGVSVSATSNELSVTVVRRLAGVEPVGRPRQRSRRTGLAVPGIEHARRSRWRSAPRAWTSSASRIGPAEHRCRRRDAAALRRASARAWRRPAGAACWSAWRSTTRITSPRAGRSTARSFDLVASDGALAAAIDTADPAQVALRIVEVVADLVAAVAMAQQAGAGPARHRRSGTTGKDVRFLLQGVVLADVPNPTQLIAGVFDPATLLARIHQLFTNIAAAGITIPVGRPRRSPSSSTATRRRSACVSASTDRFELLSGDVMLWLENDDRWITPIRRGDRRPVRRLHARHAAAALRAEPGRRRPRPARRQVLGAAARRRHHARVDRAARLRRDRRRRRARAAACSCSSPTSPCRRSGAQGEQRHRAGHHARHRARRRRSRRSRPRSRSRSTTAGRSQVSLRAGDGAGPWWIAIQKGFGPLYLEQIGFGATMPAAARSSASRC